ncbi:MAG: hypothetical protein ABSB71_09570 [Candidatus Bathyarchaeia archaeon]|jgi:hypothetical protein
MPYKSKEERQKHNREQRAKERLEFKTLRTQTSKIRELLQSAPTSANEALAEIEKILSASPTPADYIADAEIPVEPKAEPIRHKHYIQLN